MTALFTHPSPVPQPPFLPMTRTEMDRLGWAELDVLLVSGDAYVDHPSFGVALLGRLLVAHGLRTGIIAQPDWTNAQSVTAMGRPRLYAGVSAGAIDSQLAHYTAFRKKRSDDAYTPGGMAGARPNRACIVYTNLLRQSFPGLPVVLGGIEASLRRITHYDFWTDALRKSILLDAKASILVYGMGERAAVDIARRIQAQQPLDGIPGTVIADRDPGQPCTALPDHEAMLAEPAALMRATLTLESQVHHGTEWLSQSVGARKIYVAPPAAPLSGQEMDQLYALPFARVRHPAYAQTIPAEAMIRDSITSHRGCGGGCSFCTLALHQGRRISSRSRNSILAEARTLATMPGFSGSISDVGGPSANMWGAQCAAQDTHCTRSSCMTPRVCPHFRMDQGAHVDMLRAVLRTPGIRHVRVASGIRYDLALQDRTALGRYVREFVGGQLKIAPEHICDSVLALMRKPRKEVFEEFLALFHHESAQAHKQQFVIPYLMSAFPGTTDEDMRTLHAWLTQQGWRPQQVQCFIPIPGAVATAMYYAGTTPKGVRIPVARTDEQRLRQHHILMPATDVRNPRAPQRTSGAKPRAAAPGAQRPASKAPKREDRTKGKQSKQGKQGKAHATKGKHGRS